MAGGHLFGRDVELGRLDALVRGVHDRGGALVVHGEAGIGKTRLLAEARRIAAAAGMLVLATAGVEAESRVPFAGLHKLLQPVLARAEALPGPQRDAVLGAFGMADVGGSDLFLIALAVLNLLADAATGPGALLVVEDAHWLDPATAEILGFVGRRLEADPVLLLAAVRDGFPTSFGTDLPRLRLDRLDEEAAEAVLDAHVAGLPAGARRQLLQDAAGNPLALVELSSATGRADPAGPMTARPLTDRLQEAFAARMVQLPAATRTLLLVAATNDGDALSEALAAAALVTGGVVTAGDLPPAVAASLVDVDGDRIRFRHPLMRSAIHQWADLTQRDAAHAALARVLTGRPERGIWHRAASGHGPDEEVAAGLEEIATAARRRGATLSALAALERAAQLTDDPARRAARLLRAAEAAVELGRQDVVHRLLHDARTLELSSWQRAQLLWIEASFGGGLRDEHRRPAAVADVAEAVAADGHVDVAVRLLNGAALRSFWTEADLPARHRIVDVAEGLPIRADDPDLLAILAFAAPIERGAAVIDSLHRGAARAGGNAEALRLVGSAAVLVGAFDLAEACCTAALPDLRAQGRLGLVARALGAQAWSAAHLADLNVGIPAAEECTRLARETSQPLFVGIGQATAAVLAALRGDEAAVLTLAGAAEQAATSGRVRPVLATARLARGLAALGAGRYADAYEHLRRMHDPADPSFHPALRCFALSELADAAVHSGQHDAVTGIVAELEAFALQTPSPALHGGLRHARAVLAGDDEAEALFEAALRVDAGPWPFARARVQLAYGQWLRRQRRIADSRTLLRTARDTFDTLGTVPWGDHARRELRASGETSRRQIVDARDRLTAQELQIAQMAAEGMTNREIGERLYLSHRTISSHLHRIFPKLEITSRSQLAGIVRVPAGHPA
ncbi:AAA family ATPase [Dactylosporangium siamense]|uniref:LuxR family transcriptional regulator n=2 Tax=Dactylosporangium siamense TaxID=685454 RepID=A0A919PHP5_9ACTN|nr:LuxR family transcriptional regulator [Dactylosporangium siamense]GIG43864.1 LuxR family transcriptional regulator [Dactylosporangium siamense]